ncbi:MAG: large conductance mechanosensitive channel protein MscL [Propionibacteriaceae bacterium]|jgi:large conductance mechanosensitive channel|nr:large conductance mechanosensitive channel protein MscL [Propionibacteriaceae bacterium]
MIRGFRDFIARGNVVDLAVGVVVGAAFTTIVTALVDGLISPLIAVPFGQPDFDDVLVFTLHGSKFQIGLLITAVVKFVLTAGAIYSCIVYPLNRLAQRRAQSAPAAPAQPSQVELLTEIRDLLRARSDGPRL